VHVIVFVSWIKRNADTFWLKVFAGKLEPQAKFRTSGTESGHQGQGQDIMPRGPRLGTGHQEQSQDTRDPLALEDMAQEVGSTYGPKKNSKGLWTAANHIMSAQGIDEVRAREVWQIFGQTVKSADNAETQ
jgi:hypothetical protein